MGKATKILVVGQTPPPFGGQAVMIQELLKGQFEHIELHHVRMAFSEDMDSVGKFKIKKVLVLFQIIASIWVARFKTGAMILYYPPSGPNKVPVFRDVILLTFTRFLFSKTVFHFHAGGVSEYRSELPGPLRAMFDISYKNHDLAIRTSALNPDDGEALGAKKSIVIPNGIRDMSGTIQATTSASGEPLRILFTGVLIESKGVEDLIDSFLLVRAAGKKVELKVMGRWGDLDLKSRVEQKLEEAGETGNVEFYGVLSGDEKFRAFATCDIFCFPSWFEAETFGLVIVEAMQFNKPVVSTNWRGIPSVVEDGVSGTLVDIQKPEKVAEALIALIDDPALRDKMGQAGRRIFEQKFSIDRFYERMEQAFVEMERK